MTRHVPRDPVRGCAGAILCLAWIAGLATPAVARRGDAGRAPVEEKRFVYAGIPWFTPGDSVRARLAGSGFHIVPGTAETVVAQGRSFDRLTVVHALLDDSLRVVRWEVKVLPEAQKSVGGTAYSGDDPFPPMKRVYDDVVAECQGRYGRPLDQVESYGFPYDKGDGREADALHDHQAVIRSAWHARRSGDRLTVEMDGDVNVVVTYTCTAWSGFQDRQRHRKGRNL